MSGFILKDLDAIRAALGDKRPHLGYSYGTRIGSAYAEEFPQRVRAMILTTNCASAQCHRRRSAPGKRLSRTRSHTPSCAKNAGCRWAQEHSQPSGLPQHWSADSPRIRQAGAHEDHARAELTLPSWAPLWRCTHRIWRRHLTDGLSELVDNRGDTLLALADVIHASGLARPLQQFR